MTVMAGTAGVPHALNALPTAAAVTVLCVLAVGWWRRRRPSHAGARMPPRRGRAARWLTAAGPSLAGAAGCPTGRSLGGCW
jgi:hypothetical protein